MTCAWYERQLANDSVELWRNGRPSNTLLEHARACSSCDRLIEEELELKLLTTELAEQSRSLEPGPAVKHNLFAQFDAMQQSVKPRWAWRFAFAAAVVACLAIGFFVSRFHRTVHRADDAVRSAVPQVQAHSARAAEPPKAAPPMLAAAKARVKPANARPAAQPAASNEFYPVVMCDSLTCAGPTVAVRVELPSSPLTGRSTPVMADLLVGEDGLVRGVRLLQ